MRNSQDSQIYFYKSFEKNIIKEINCWAINYSWLFTSQGSNAGLVQSTEISVV